jgi:hypothetical protein
MHFEDMSKDIRAASAALTKVADTIDAALAARQSRAANGTPPAPAPAQRNETPSGRHDNPTCPFGRNKGLPLAELSDRDLEWIGGALQESLDDPEKRVYARKNAADLENVRREQYRRRGDA